MVSLLVARNSISNIHQVFHTNSVKCGSTILSVTGTTHHNGRNNLVFGLSKSFGNTNLSLVIIIIYYFVPIKVSSAFASPRSSTPETPFPLEVIILVGTIGTLIWLIASHLSLFILISASIFS